MTELSDTDERHDGYGEALFHLAHAYLAVPTASAEAKATARYLLDNFVPHKAHLRASYATEADRAERRRPRLETDRAVLDRLPVEGGTAHGWAAGYIEAGAELGVLLSGRVDATPDRSPASMLRGRAIAQVNRMRQIIGDELDATPDRLRPIDQRCFGYFDLLADMRARGSKDPTPPAPIEPPAPA